MYTTTIEHPPTTIHHKFKVGDTISHGSLQRVVAAVELSGLPSEPVYRFTEWGMHTVEYVDSHYALVEPERYVPQVGDMVRRSTWGADAPDRTVTAVGEKMMLLRYPPTGREEIYEINGNWIKVAPETPLPETWTNRYTWGSSVYNAARNAEIGRDSSDTIICTTHEFGTFENPQIEVVWTPHSSVE